jgi:hypothetical protein
MKRIRAEARANQIIGKVVSRTLVTMGSYGEKHCAWLNIEFKDRTKLVVPLLCMSWETSELWPKKKNLLPS